MPIRIGLFGQFGCGNSGNDGSLEAMLTFLRRCHPDGEIATICPGPENVRRDYGIAAIGIGWPGIGNAVAGSFDKMLFGVPRAFASWLYTLRQAGRFDLIIVPGTGILDDFAAAPRNIPYALFRWCVCARLCGTRVWFVSVGAGPIEHRFSRWLLKHAAMTAQYRSYRDTISREFMAGLGVDTRLDPVYPDIAFKLPLPELPPRRTDGTPLTVGLGVMSYRGWRDDPAEGAEILRTYVDKITQFLIWLLDRGCNVRLLIGDATDQSATALVLAKLAEAGRTVPSDRLSVAPSSTLRELMEQIALCDIVVASRFHNIVCALKLGRPVISISYARKNDALLAEMGLGEFCQHIDRFDVESLKRQMVAIDGAREEHKRKVRQAIRVLLERLAEQDVLLSARLLCFGASEPSRIAA